MPALRELCIYAAVYAGLFLLCCFTVFKTPVPVSLSKKSGGCVRSVAGISLLGLLLYQLYLTSFMPGHVQDTGLFRAWTAFAGKQPLWHYYKTDLYVDYPPVYLYVLYLLGKLANFFGVQPDSSLYLVFVRSVPILFDSLTTFCIYRFSRQKIGEKKALCLALLSAVNPVNLMNSTLWGQIDSVTAFMVGAMLLLLYKKQYVFAFTMLAVLFLTKPQMIIFAPLLGFIFLSDLAAVWKDRPARNKMFYQAGLSFLAIAAVFLLVPLPITGGNYMLLIDKFRHALGLYPYATLNAANLYGALGANWEPDTTRWFFFSYKTWGFIFIVCISLLVGYISFKQQDRNKIFYLGAFTVLGIYMLAHGMHERYMHPLFLLLILAYIQTGDKKQLWFYGAFSVTVFLGCGQVLLLNQQNEFVYADNVFFRVLAVVHLVLFVLWLLHGARLMRKKDTGGAIHG